MGSSRRDRRLSSEPRPSKRVLTLRPSPSSTLPRSACTPSTSAELTPGPTTTGRRCTRATGKLSGLSTLRPPGRRSTMNGARGPPRSCPSGLVRGPARRLVPPSPLRVRRRLRPLLLRRRIMKRRKKRRRSTMRRRNRLFTTTDKVQVLTSSHISHDLLSSNIPDSDWFCKDFHHQHGLYCPPLHHFINSNGQYFSQSLCSDNIHTCHTHFGCAF